MTKGNKNPNTGKRHIRIQEVSNVPEHNDAPDGTTTQEETLYVAPALAQRFEGGDGDVDDDTLLEAVNAKDMDEDEQTQQDTQAHPDGSAQEETPETPGHGDVNEATDWTRVAPDFRIPEVTFISKVIGSAMSVDENGNLMAPVTMGAWTMLLVYDNRFPRPAEHGSVARLYFVNPTPEEVATVTGIPVETFSQEGSGDGGERYLIVDGFADFHKTYMSGRSDILMAERLLSAASQLKSAYDDAKAAAERLASKSTWTRPTITHRRYTDTRTTTPGTRRHPACRKVVLSNRAFVQIYNETQAHIRTETGGLLLGHYENGIWYVVEASDPGWDAVFQHSYHEANEDYENHVCEIMSRTYRHPLAFLGMWHRHPGSLDTFSGTDDDTNSKYVDACGNGCISALVNYDPSYRLTFYYVERTRDGGVAYYQVDVEVGDELFENREILQLACVPYPARGVKSQPDPPADANGRNDRPGAGGHIPPTSTGADKRKQRGRKGRQPDSGIFPFPFWH